MIDTPLAGREELVQLGGLPAGNYVIWATVSDDDFGRDDVACVLEANGTTIQVDPASDFGVDVGNTTTEIATLAAPANTTVDVTCGRDEGLIGGPPTIQGRIVAMKVDALS